MQQNVRTWDRVTVLDGARELLRTGPDSSLKAFLLLILDESLLSVRWFDTAEFPTKGICTRCHILSTLT